MMRTFINLIGIFLLLNSYGQQDATIEPFSENGWYLSPHGTIRILVLYAEIEYDVKPGKDPQPNGSEQWKKGQLPTWKDEVFDVHLSPRPKAMVSKYYHDISLGRYNVLGDYVTKLITIKESEHKNLSNLSRVVAAEANKLGSLKTAGSLQVSDFDMWKDNGKPGKPKEAGSDEPHRYDHTMVIVRNSSRLTHGQGSTDSGSPGKLFGFESDTQSRFGAMNGLPFEILKHEFNHLLLGGNNFHSGGGNAPMFESFFICQQGGWSMMGSANSSFLTTSAWDRYRLGWKATDSSYLIRVRTPAGKELNGDLDPLAGDTGVFVIEDMVSKGDAMRIRMPYIPEDEFQQWLWIENHQGYGNNGSPTDKYHWQGVNDCIADFQPGIYMQMQIDREQKRGAGIYRGYADYLRPVLANGNHDFLFTGEHLDKTCPFHSKNPVFEVRSNRSNPLSGTHEQELPVFDKDGNSVLDRKEHYVPYVRKVNGQIEAQTVLFGRPEHAFTAFGNNKIGMGTNPSTSNMLTLVRSGSRAKFGNTKPNNRTVYLNGISVEVLKQDKNGPVSIRVRANDTRIDQDLRWAADSIVLPQIVGFKGYSLYLTDKHTIKVDRGFTPTRNDRPEVYRGKTYFNSPSNFTLSENTETYLGNNSKLLLQNGSSLHVLPGALLELAKGAELSICSDCEMILHEGAKIILHEKSEISCSGSIVDLGVELFQDCKGDLVTQGDKKALTCKKSKSSLTKYKKKTISRP